MTKRRHHYVPQFYLRNFADPKTDGKVWIYAWTGEKLNAASPRDLAVEKDYHTVTTHEGIKDRHTIEETLGVLENKAAPVIQKILRGDILTLEEHQFFVVFVAQVLLRVPARRDEAGRMMAGVLKQIAMRFASDKESYHRDYCRFQEETGDISTVDPEEVRQFMLSGDCVVEANPTAALGLSLSAIDTVVTCLLKMKWVVLEARGRFKFITCDNPVFFCDPTIRHQTWQGVGLMNPGVEVSFPLSPKVAAFASYHEGPRDRITVTPEIVRRFNQQTVRSAHRYIFSCEESPALERFIAQNEHTKSTAERDAS